jgi:hypothetical protein
MSTNHASVCAFEHVPLQFQFQTARLAYFDPVTDPDDYNEGERMSLSNRENAREAQMDTYKSSNGPPSNFSWR